MAPRCTDFLLQSTRLLTPQVLQQQCWCIACILAVKCVFQHITLCSNPQIPGFGLAQSWDFGIEERSRILGSRDYLQVFPCILWGCSGIHLQSSRATSIQESLINCLRDRNRILLGFIQLIIMKDWQIFFSADHMKYLILNSVVRITFYMFAIFFLLATWIEFCFMPCF